MTRIVITAPLSTGLAATAIVTTLASYIIPWLGGIRLLWPFLHGNITHLVGNLTLFLLLSPILEARYGAWRLLAVYLVTALVVSAAFEFLFGGYLIGASGQVFAAIGMIGFAGAKHREIPLHMVLLVLLFAGGEIFKAVQADNISQFAHLGGLGIGIIAGMVFRTIPAPGHPFPHVRI